MDKFNYPEHKGCVYINRIKKSEKFDVYIQKISHAQPRFVGTAEGEDAAKELGVRQLSTFGRM